MRTLNPIRNLAPLFICLCCPHSPMFRSASLVLFAASTVDAVLTAPQTESTPSICAGYLWGVIIEQVLGPPNTVYNRQSVSSFRLEHLY